MALHQEPVTLDVPIREAIAWIGVVAQSARTPAGQQAAHLCLEIASGFDEESTTTIQIPAIKVLCHLCDTLNAQGNTEAVAKVERVIKLLKPTPARIVGVVNHQVQSLGQLDDALEGIRKNFQR